MEENKKERWKELCNDIKEKIKSPLGYPEFIFYFFVVVVMTGLVGIFLTYYVENKLTNEDISHKFSHIHLTLSIASYFIALVTASSVDLILSLKSEDNFTKKPYIMIGICAIILGLCLMGGVLLSDGIPVLEYIFAIVGLLISWFIWWLSNSENPNLTINPIDAIPPPVNLTGNEAKYKL